MAFITSLLTSSSRTLVLAATFAILVIWTTKIFKTPVISRNGKPLRKPPSTLPLLGNGIIFLQPRHKLFQWFSHCERYHFPRLETFQISVPTLPPGVVINDPVNLEYVFKNEAIFQKGGLFKRLSWDLFGNGIINADGRLWKAQRKAGLEFLSGRNLKVLMEVVLPGVLGKCVSALDVAAASAAGGDVEEIEDGKDGHEGDLAEGGGGLVDLQDVFHEITSQLMGKMAYDMEMHTGDEFTRAFEHASACTTERFQNPLWFITEVFTASRFQRSLRTVREFGMEIVKAALEKRDEQGTKENKDEDGNGEAKRISGSLIYSLLDTLGREDEKLVADAALNYLSAGRDTVAQALTWTVYLLLKNKFAIEGILNEIYRLRKQAEVANKQSPDSRAGLPSVSCSDTDLFAPSSATYTMAVFYEALRLYPPIPFEIKQCSQPTTLPDGTFLPNGTIVFWSPWAMNRSHTIWGSNSDEFCPERWLARQDNTAGSPLSPVAGHVLKSRSASEFPVFNGGQRLCLGKKMAEIMAAQILPKLVERFEFEPAFDLSIERRSGSSLTLPMEGGLPCYVRLR